METRGMPGKPGIVSFDLWMTLIKSNGRTFKTARNLLLRDTLSSDMDADAFDQLVRVADKQADIVAERRGRDVQFAERVNMVAEAAGRPALTGVALETLYDEQSALFAANPPILIGPNTQALLTQLSGDRDLAIVSNTGFIRGREMRQALGQLGIRDMFKHLIFSDEVGYAKPSPRIFAQLLDQAGVAPQHITHVGDNLIADVAGAEAMCIRAIHMEPGMTLSDVVEEL